MLFEGLMEPSTSTSMPAPSPAHLFDGEAKVLEVEGGLPSFLLPMTLAAHGDGDFVFQPVQGILKLLDQIGHLIT